MKRSVFFLFCGLTASGKSFLARRYAKAAALPYLDYDTIVQPMLRTIEEREGVGNSRAAFYRKWRKPCYDCFWDTCAEILGCGSSLVASAPCGEEIGQTDFFSKLRTHAGVDFRAVSIYLAPESSFHLSTMKMRNAIWNEDIIPDWNNYRKNHSPHIPVWDADVNLYLEYGSFEQLDHLFGEKMMENGLETFDL